MAVFESMSRVAEIADLHINEVTRGRKAITIRPKTGARTWLKTNKKVHNMQCLECNGQDGSL